MERAIFCFLPSSQVGRFPFNLCPRRPCKQRHSGSTAPRLPFNWNRHPQSHSKRGSGSGSGSGSSLAHPHPFAHRTLSPVSTAQKNDRSSGRAPAAAPLCADRAPYPLSHGCKTGRRSSAGSGSCETARIRDLPDSSFILFWSAASSNTCRCPLWRATPAAYNSKACRLHQHRGGQPAQDREPELEHAEHRGFKAV